MLSKDIEDYLMKGIHGHKETKLAERRKFLGTLRERIIIALTQSQIRESGIYPQIETAFKNHRDAHLYLNGNMNYSELSKYTQLATKYNIDYTIVTNKDYNSNIGLAFAYNYAIDKDEIYVKSKIEKKATTKNTKKKSFFDLFSKVFKRRTRGSQK